MTSSNEKIFRVTGHLCGVPGEFPAQRPVTRSFDVFFDLRLNKRFSKQSWGWWFETLSRPLWRHFNECITWITRSRWNNRNHMHHNKSVHIVWNILCNPLHGRTSCFRINDWFVVLYNSAVNHAYIMFQEIWTLLCCGHIYKSQQNRQNIMWWCVAFRGIPFAHTYIHIYIYTYIYIYIYIYRHAYIHISRFASNCPIGPYPHAFLLTLPYTHTMQRSRYITPLFFEDLIKTPNRVPEKARYTVCFVSAVNSYFDPFSHDISMSCYIGSR